MSQEIIQELLRFAIAERDAFYDCCTDAEGNLTHPGDQAELDRMDQMIDRSRTALSANDGEAVAVNMMFSSGHNAALKFTASDRRFFVSYPPPPYVPLPKGWKLVPINITKEMCEAAAEKRGCQVSANLYAAIRDAVLAAPEPDHSPDAGKVVLDLAPLDNAYCMGWIKASEWGECEDLLSDMDSPAFEQEKGAALTYIQNKYAAPAADGGVVEPVGWAEINKLIQQYVNDYEYTDGEGGGYYTPTDWQRHMIEDAIHGVLSEVPLQPVTHPAQPRNEVQAEALEKFGRKGLEALPWIRSLAADSEEKVYRLATEEADRLRSNGG